MDDIGKKKTGADFYDESLFKLIEKRYGRKATTIYTSNIPLDRLVVDPAVFTRINSRVVSIRMPELNIRGSEDEAAKEIITRVSGL